MLNNSNVIYTIASMIDIHDNKHILKSISVILANASKFVIFTADLLTDNRMESIVTNILLSGEDQERWINLFEVWLSIISNTKIPVKFMIASWILRLTDPKLKILSKTLNRDCVLQLIQVLTYILNSLDSKMYTNVKQEELSRKTHKYCLLAMTKIIIRYDPQLIFDPKIIASNGDLKLILNGASFEQDPQIHLRLLYILYNISEIKPSTPETSEIVIEFLMNIYNFRYVLTMEDDYHYLIESWPLANSVQAKEKSALGVEQREQILVEEGSINSKPIPLNLSEKNYEVISKHKSSSSLNKDTNEEEEEKATTEDNTEINPFYFENEDYALTKLDGLRMSLWMTVMILSRLSSVNRRANCTQIFNSKFDKFKALFDYFHPITHNNSFKCNQYIIWVLEIILNGSEIGKLEEIISKKDTAKHLMELLKVALDKGINDMVMIIIKIFLHLSSDARFHSDLLSLHLLSLLNSSKLRDNENKEIKNIANDLFENMIKNNSQKYSYILQYDSEELKSVKGAHLSKQVAFLKNFEEALQQNKVKLDQLPEVDVDILLEVCKFETYGEDMDNSVSYQEEESERKAADHSESEMNKSDDEDKNDKDNVSFILFNIFRTSFTKRFSMYYL